MNSYSHKRSTHCRYRIPSTSGAAQPEKLVTQRMFQPVSSLCVADLLQLSGIFSDDYADIRGWAQWSCTTGSRRTVRHALSENNGTDLAVTAVASHKMAQVSLAISHCTADQASGQGLDAHCRTVHAASVPQLSGIPSTMPQKQRKYRL
jgi:hypothetical protein